MVGGENVVRCTAAREGAVMVVMAKVMRPLWWKEGRIRQ